jgi:hypothetical protein
MFSYEVSNAPKSINFVLLDKVFAFACKYLDIHEHIVLEFETLGKGHCGYCDCDVDEEDEETTIVISKSLSVKDVIRTIFHEMVHVKQYMDGRLVTGYQSRWMGETYDCDYNELPWEVEAFDLEAKMFNAYNEEKNG